MTMSKDCAQVAAAMVAFQAEVTNPAKARTAAMGSYSYTYAALPDIVEELRPLLAKHKLAVIQSVGSFEDRITVTTLVLHETGEWIESDMLMMSAGSKPQDAGSAITYARRYSYAATLGLVTDDDADGQQSTPKKAATKRKFAASKSNPEPPDASSAPPLTLPEMPKDRPDTNAAGEEYIGVDKMVKMLDALRGKVTDDALLDLADQFYEVPSLWHLTVNQARTLSLSILNGPA